MTGDEWAVFEVSPAVAWVKDAGQTLLVDTQAQTAWTLHGVEAAIWDLLAMGYSGERIAQLLGVLLAVQPSQAAETLADVVRAWKQAGILQAAGGARDG